MKDKATGLSRREFVAGASGAVLASTLQGTRSSCAANQANRLAIEGGEKAVQIAATKRPRWGQPELQQLEEMLQQNSLFYWHGPQTALLIERFREFCPLQHVQTCSSGTAALHIAVAAAGIGPGDEVITTPVTDIGSVIGVLYQQAVPVFADVNVASHNLDPVDVERRITTRTKAIIAVHLAGNPCDLAALKDIADHHNLILIEDCAQAWGARYQDRPIGTIGHFGCFSLQDSKHVTCGEGGVVATNDERFGPLLQRFGDKGNDRNDWGFRAFATNYRMSEPQAAVAAAQLKRLEPIAARRARLGNLLTEKIRNAPGILPHEVRANDRAVYWFYLFRLDNDQLSCNRSEFYRALTAEGVKAWGGYIKMPLYAEPVFRNHAFFAGRWPVKEMGLTDMDFSEHHCPNAESMLTESIRLPIYEYMTEEYILAVADAINKVAAHYAV